MVGVMVGTAAAARQTAAEAATSVAIVVAFTVVPMMLLMLRQVRRGVWENVDASNRTDRPVLYAVSLLVAGALLVYLALFQPQSFLIRGVAMTLGMVAVSGLATRWIKVSLHTAFGALAAMALTLMRSPVGYALLFALPVLIWSRLTLKRHSIGEVVLGGVIGAAAGVAIHYL